MDLVTQGVIGAAAAGTVAPRKQLRRWCGVGALAGWAPDLDVLIRSSSDPLLFLEFHRHFTHSLFFIPFGAAIVSFIVSRLAPRHFAFGAAFGPALVGYATHGLLDACTSYGTFLFWPLSAERVAWNTISIVDPIFTGFLLGGLLFALVRGGQNRLRVGVLAAVAYLCLGFYQHARALHVQEALADSRGHPMERFEVKPSFGNNFLFRSYYQSGDIYHVDAIRIPWFGSEKIYEGASIAALKKEQPLKSVRLSEIQRQDVKRFAYFSNNYLIRHPARSDVIGDLRYAFLPNAIEPLWGIQIIEGQVEQHTPFLNFREMDRATRRLFWEMLKGDDLNRSKNAQ